MHPVLDTFINNVRHVSLIKRKSIRGSNWQCEGVCRPILKLAAYSKAQSPISYDNKL